MARTFRGMWTRLIFVFALAATALAQSPVSDDTYVTSASPSSTNGSSPSLVVQAPAGWTFIKLDLSRIPTGTQASAVSKATLKLYVTAATAQGAFDAFRVDSTWKEANLTYSNSTAPNQSAQALVLTPISTGTCSGTPVQCVTTTSKYVIVDVTSIVKDWINFQNGVGGAHANNGIAFKPSSGSSISATFESKESTTTSHDTDLEVDYATSLASIPGTIGPSQVAPGTYAINISGTAATASQFDHVTNQCAANMFSIGITTAGHANCTQVQFSSLGGTATTAQLPTGIVFNNQANTFGAGFKQTFTPSAALAGLNIVGATNDPTTPSNGDLWFNTTAGRLGFRVAGVTKQLAFAGDPLSGDGSGLTNLNASQLSSGTVPAARLSGTYGINISGSAASITGNIPESQVTNLPTDLGNLSSSISSEASARTSADTTLQNNINAETSARSAADTTLQNNINAESATRAAADSTLSASIASETSRAQGAESTITGNLNNEISRATAAEATKADLVKPVRLDNAAAVNGSCSAVNALVLNPSQPSGQQMFICRDIGGGTLQWELINDDATSTAADHTYTDQQVAAEASARTSADNAEASARQSADTTLQANIDTEATARAAADTTLQNNINAETSRAQGAESTITTNLNSEITRATGAEAAEAATRAAADVSLGAAITAETSRATGAETTLQGNIDTLSASAAKLATDNTFTGQNTFTGPKIDMSGAGATLPVQTTNTTPPASGQANACVTGQMLLQVNGAAGQQLFICNASLDGWVMVNDDTTSTAADHTYTDQQVSAEASARTSADNAEAAARQSADTTLQANIDAEAAARATADTTLQNNLNAETSRAQGAEAAITSNLNGEISRATSAEAVLGASITAETTRAQGAESTITTNLNAEVSRATAAEATKADLVKPVQLDNAAAVNGSCSAVNALVLNPAQPSGQQMFICRDIGGGTLQWELINDDATSTAADHAYTDSQVAVEAAARTSADNAEAAARAAADTTLLANIDAEAAARAAADSAEASARAAADTTLQNNIDAEFAARQAADTTLQNNINAEAATRASADASLSAAITSETSRATGAETTLQSNIDSLSASSAKLATDNTFTGNNTFTGAKVDMSGATSTLPVQTTNTTPPASGQVNACVAGQMLLQVNGAPGQQLFICNSSLDGWVMVNDDAASSAADHSYTDSQITIEAAARSAADSAETSARQSADATLQSNIDSEVSRAQGAEANITSSVNSEITRATGAEVAETTTRAAADVALGASIAAETTRATGAESTITSSLNAEISRATTAETTKADLVKPVQLDNAAAVNGSCTAVNSLVLNTNEPSGQQLFICRDIGGGTLQWQLINDDAATTAADHAYTDSQVAAEASARTSADAAETSARQAADATLQSNIDSEVSRAQAAEAAEAAARAAADSAETTARQAADATLQSNIDAEAAARTAADSAEAAARAAADAAEAVARANGDAASIATANAYTDSAVTTINSTLATKANLAGGNSFAGDQTVNGTLSLPAVGSGPSASQAFDMAGADGSNQPTLFRWQVNNTGLLNLFTATSGNPAQDSGLKIGSDGKITFAAGQTFPGTQNTLTAGTGISILSNTISNTGVLSFNGRNGAVTPQSADYSFAQISGTITPSQVSNGTYGIDISGNAATATLAANATNAANASLLSGEAAATAATASTIAARDASADLFANVFHGSGANLTNIPTGALPASVVYNNQANTYTAGSKQTFKASATLAGLNVFGVATDPTGPLAAGDAWYNTTANRLKFYNGTVSKNVAFTDDSITGNASTASAFDHTPTQCTTNNFATGIAASGNANCSQPSFTNLSGQATNSQLQNSSLTVTAGTGLSGGGSVSLGGSTTVNIANTTVTAGTYTHANVTVDAQGRITAATSNTPAGGSQSVSGTTTSTTYTPTLTGGTGASASLTVSGTHTALVTITTNCSSSGVSGTPTGCMASFVISGSTTLAASDARAAGIQIAGGSGGNTASVSNYSGGGTYLVTLNSGTSTLTANYKALGGGTATFTSSSIIVQVF